VRVEATDRLDRQPVEALEHGVTLGRRDTAEQQAVEQGREALVRELALGEALETRAELDGV
jgi:hypothetical protein